MGFDGERDTSGDEVSIGKLVRGKLPVVSEKRKVEEIVRGKGKGKSEKLEKDAVITYKDAVENFQKFEEFEELVDLKAEEVFSDSFVVCWWLKLFCFV